MFHFPEGRLKVLDIMNATQNMPRPDKKSNHPVTENTTIPVEKIRPFVDFLALTLKPIVTDSGVKIKRLEGNEYNIFAPNQQLFDETKEKIDEFLAQDVSFDFVTC